MEQAAIHHYFSRRNRRESVHVTATEYGSVFATDRICFVDITPYAQRFRWCREAFEQPGKSLTIPTHHMNAGSEGTWYVSMLENWRTWCLRPAKETAIPTNVVAELKDGERYRFFSTGQRLLAYDERVLAMLGPTLGHLGNYTYDVIERDMLRVTNQEKKVVMLAMGLAGAASLARLNLDTGGIEVLPQ